MKSRIIKIIIIVAVIVIFVATAIAIALMIAMNTGTDRLIEKAESAKEELQEETQNSNEISENTNQMFYNVEDTDETSNEINSEYETISDSEIESFNSKFDPYEGENVKGTQVNALLQTIRTTNMQIEDHQVKAMADVQNWDYDNNMADAQSSYKVTCETDDEGYINIIKIEDVE